MTANELYLQFNVTSNVEVMRPMTVTKENILPINTTIVECFLIELFLDFSNAYFLMNNDIIAIHITIKAILKGATI